MTRNLRRGAVILFRIIFVLIFSHFSVAPAHAGLVIKVTSAADGGTVVDFSGQGKFVNGNVGTSTFNLLDPDFVEGLVQQRDNSPTGTIKLLSNSSEVTATRMPTRVKIDFDGGQDEIIVLWDQLLGTENYLADFQAVFSLSQLPFEKFKLGSYAVNPASVHPFDSVTVAVSASSPEPSSMLILGGIGAIGIASHYRKKRRRKHRAIDPPY